MYLYSLRGAECRFPFRPIVAGAAVITVALLCLKKVSFKEKKILFKVQNYPKTMIAVIGCSILGIRTFKERPPMGQNLLEPLEDVNLAQIVSFLPPQDLHSFAQTCKRYSTRLGPRLPFDIVLPHLTRTEKVKVESCKSFKELREVMNRTLFCAHPDENGSVNGINYRQITSNKMEGLAKLIDLHVTASEKFARLFFELGCFFDPETPGGNLYTDEAFKLIENLAFQLYDSKLHLREQMLKCYFGEEVYAQVLVFAQEIDWIEKNNPDFMTIQMTRIKLKLEELSKKKMPPIIENHTFFSSQPNCFEEVDEYFCSYDEGNTAYFTKAAWQKHRPCSAISEGARALDKTHQLQKTSNALGYGEIFCIPPSAE